MKGDHSDLAQALNYIDPAALDYQKWIDVGMALHESGLSCSLWDTWSSKDTRRYHPGECARKWDGFGNGATKVTSGTIVAMARARGWEPHYASAEPDEALGWDDTVQAVSPAWADDIPVEDADEGPWDQAGQISDYLDALFDDDDHVGIVTRAWQRDGRWLPQKGTWSKTAGQLRQELAKCAGDVGKVIGDWPQEAGAWVRINPLDGKGCGNSDVTEYRYSLVESDEVPIERQRGMIEAMNLPCAAIVSSGNKSVHAIVKVDAGTDYDLYRKRVERLYQYCAGHGFAPDTQNKNPSRLSRLPGVTRNGRRQMLLATSCGAGSWTEWEDWVAETEDDLPDDVCDDWDAPIRLAPPLIGTEENGVLRQGQKLVLAAPSKSGKSFAIVDLAEAIACGGTWLGWPCAEGRVFYVNLEIADESFRWRQHVVWADREAHEDVGSGLDSIKRNFVRWDLRGHAEDMSRLAPRLIHRVLRRGPRGSFMAVIVDPIYKVNGGDENDAEAISDFTNQLDRISNECGCAVLYVHHHSKGSPGARRSADRMSGSGVFARDADAILDLSPIHVPSDRARRLLGRPDGGLDTAWRLTATLREFKTPDPVDLVWKFPRFYRDVTGSLSGFDVEGENPMAEANEKRRDRAATDNAAIVAAIRSAVGKCGNEPTRAEVLKRMNDDLDYEVTEENIKYWTTSKCKWSPFRAKNINGKWLLYDTNEPLPWGDDDEE